MSINILIVIFIGLFFGSLLEFFYKSITRKKLDYLKLNGNAQVQIHIGLFDKEKSCNNTIKSRE